MSVSRNSITRLDASQFRRDAETGFLFAPVQPTRAGVFVYQDSSGKTVRELRDDADVFDPVSLATLENAVITNSHPPEMVNADNVEKYQVGNTFGPHRRADDGLHTRTDAVVRDSKAIADIDRGKQEVSCGYRCDVIDEPGIHPVHGEYDRKQTNIRYNHLAIEWRGRAGSGARLRTDSEQYRFDAWEIPADNDNNKEAPMSEQKPEVQETKTDALQEQIKKVVELEQKLDSVTAERDKLQGAVEGLQSQLEEAQKFDKDAAVNARIALIKQAEAHLPQDFKFDGLTDEQIKSEVIKAKMPESKLDGYSAERIDGMYEVVLNAPAPKQERTDSFTKANEIYQNAERTDAHKQSADAYAAMVAKKANKWKEGK